MKLITYMRIATEKKTGAYVKKPQEKPYVRLYKKNGLITFSNELCNVLQIKKYFSVSIHQDADNIKKWYLEFGAGDYTIYEINSSVLGFSCIKAVLNFFEFFQLEGNGIKCFISTNPIFFGERKFYEIDTSELIK